ncbi:PREDICTED: putative defense protein 1 [Branchiostoma belcheri]|uniref:Defense protein 1 n=1 Tax=Branchiostoma belcheri TaxID=7741 RepID=A0A6P5A8U1_BRABE|nr:PREDICTED: putative defense protein 1 [Branchiostoma belcheri]
MYVVLVLASALCVCTAFPFGAPKGACVDMTPGHIYFNLTRVSPQGTASPYRITVGSNQYMSGETVKVVVLVGVLSLCNAYPNGAPKEACVTMTPGHKYANLTSVHPQTTPSPYQVMVASNQYSPGATLKVMIVGPAFQGFLLQARHNGNAGPVGSFSNAPTNTKAVQCTAENDSMTHANPNTKQNITLTWTAPSDARADIMFIATVAQEKNVFWLNNTSPMVTLDQGYKKEVSGNHV